MTVKKKKLPLDGLSDSERRCLKAFTDAMKRLGVVPLLQDVAEEMGTSKQYVSAVMKSLIEKGKVVREGRYRSLRVVTE